MSTPLRGRLGMLCVRCSVPSRNGPLCFKHDQLAYQIPEYDWNCIQIQINHLNEIPFDNGEHAKVCDIVTTIAARYISHEMIGKRINKEFEDGYSYDGTVISLDLESGTRTHMFRVLYDWDGMGEDMYLDELMEYLID